MYKWETDLGKHFSQEEWNRANKSDQAKKLLMRWYQSPLKVTTFYPLSSDLR